MEGSLGHIHKITNFANEDNSSNAIHSTLNNNNSINLSINGTVDIKINGKIIRKNADLSITISKGSTITIDPYDKYTGNHFGNQQIFGIVNRLIIM
jgi:hypothetical protein